MKKPFVAVLACTLVSVTAAPVRAVPLLDLLNGGAITVGDKVFFDWTLIDLVVTDPASDPDLGLIDVVALEDPRTPGLRFEANGQLMVTGSDFLDLQFGFSVATRDSTPRIAGSSLAIGAFEFQGTGGNITIVESVFGVEGDLVAELFVEADNLLGIADLFASSRFAPEATVFVAKNVFLAGDATGDSLSLDSFDQRFRQVAEPMTLVLLASGLAGLALARRRRGSTGTRRTG